MTVNPAQRAAAQHPCAGEERQAPLIAPGVTSRNFTNQIAGTALRPDVPAFWFWLFTVAAAGACMFIIAVAILLITGVGTMGNNIPVAWAYPITNYVWWIEIAVGGSLLSSILYLLNQSWRNSINRIAEAVTLSGIACAGLFPLLHLGRPWIFYWLFPYPNTTSVQPQFRSPLVFDVFGIGTYATASVLFWYFGMIPDVAALRDRARTQSAYRFYGILALGWRGGSRQWRLHEKASLLFAGIITPLVFTVHTVVSFDFAISLLPGWHSTIFPPYFVDGAILAGLSMVVALGIPMRAAFNLSNVITERHLNNLAKLILTTSVILCYTYVIEPFTAWYSGDGFEMYTVHARATGPFAWTYWTFIVLGLGVPQLLWFKQNRTRTKRLFLIALAVITGMWVERYMLLTTSLSRDFVPSSWANFTHTAEDSALLYGSAGLFLTLFLLLVRVLPMVAIHEVRELLPSCKPGGGAAK